MKAILRDAWLADVMERPVYKVQTTGLDDCVTLGVEPSGSFYYVRIPTNQIDVVSKFAAHGFYVVDTNVTLELKFGICDNKYKSIRRATEKDKTSVESIARASFHFSRFHLDPQIEIELADKIKSQWAVNYFLGQRGDEMLIAEMNKKIVGFVQLLRLNDNGYIIDLIAVDEKMRGLGIGRSLIYAVRNILDASILRAGTQVANIASIRFYENIGFRIVESKYIMHLHR